MDVRPPGLLQCFTNAVGEQCGEEIENQLEHAASWIESQCSQTEIMQRGKQQTQARKIAFDHANI